jgi:hypothetical protein
MASSPSIARDEQPAATLTAVLSALDARRRHLTEALHVLHC